MAKLRFTSILFGILIILSACTDRQEFDESSERSKIMELHHLQKKFHFEKMAGEFALLLSENHISVNRGEINQPSRAENTARFKRYFESVEFEKWDDIKPPVIRFSDDGTMAYTIVNKEVTVNYPDKEGQKIRASTIFSWVAIYKKYPDGWKIDCVASTNKPEITSVIN